MGSSLRMVLEEFFLKSMVRAVSTTSFSFFFSRYLQCRLSFSRRSTPSRSSSSSVSFSNFFRVVLREFSATAFFSRSSARLFSETSTFSMSRWALMMSLMERCFLGSFLSAGSLETLSSLRFWRRFSLNCSKLSGFSPYFWHFSTYCFSSSAMAALRFSSADCFRACLAFSASSTSRCFRISSTILVSLSPSSFFSRLSMSFSCLRRTMVRFLMSSWSCLRRASLVLRASSMASRSSAVNLFLVFFLVRFLSSFWQFLSMSLALSSSFSSCFSTFSSSTPAFELSISRLAFLSIASLNSLTQFASFPYSDRSLLIASSCCSIFFSSTVISSSPPSIINLLCAEAKRVGWSIEQWRGWRMGEMVGGVGELDGLDDNSIGLGMYESESVLWEQDALRLKAEPKLQCLLEGKEEVVFSTNIFKYNNEGKCQQRILVVTNQAILNILKSENIIRTFIKKFINFQNKYEIKRRIPLPSLYAITITPNRNSNVFLLHVTNEHDYHYRAQNNKMLLLKVIADQYRRLTKANLQFFFKEESQLSSFITTKSNVRDRKDVKPRDSPCFLNDEYFLDRRMDDDFVCEYSHNGQSVKPKHFKQLAAAEARPGTLYFVSKDEQDRSVQAALLAQEPILLNPYYTFYSEKKQVLFIPFMMGGNLRKFLSSRLPLTPADLVFYLRQILAFLVVFHEKGKVYCNITLENILVRENGYVMLNGLEKSIQEDAKERLLFRVFGNPHYFPPEVIECRGYGPGIDVWKLGVCAFVLSKGYYPFHGNSTKELYSNILHQSIEAEGVPYFVKAMLEKDRDKRIKVRELLELEEFRADTQKETGKAPFLPDPAIWQDSKLKVYRLEPDLQ